MRDRGTFLQWRRPPRTLFASSAGALDFPSYYDIIGTVEKQTALATLSGLAQESRLDVFRLLVERAPEGLAAGEIADALGLPNATLSFHLKELAHARLVSARQVGRFIYYTANFRTMNGLVEYLTENCCRNTACDIACAPASRRKRSAR